MSSKILSTCVLLVLLLLPGYSRARVDCNGSELSVASDLKIGELTEKQCTHVHGDIVIRNLNNAKRLPSYWTVTELYGSLIIANTTDLADSVNLQNLRVIRADVKPAIQLIGNRGLRLAIGARLSHVSTRNRITYHFQENTPAFMTESQHYTLHHAAARRRPIFFTDNFFLTKTCPENAYKMWTFVFGTLCVVVSLMLVGVSCYGRPSKAKQL